MTAILFDTTKGVITFGSSFKVKANVTSDDLRSQGVRFTEDFQMNSGWTHRKAIPLVLDGEVFNFFFVFDPDEKLRILRFCDVTDSGVSRKTLCSYHNALLAKYLGEPTFTREMNVLYRYKWGAISSGIDEKGGSAEIAVKWI